MADFKQAYDITMAHEGGYVNDPQDRGGETYKGISRKNFPAWEGWQIIDRYKSDESYVGQKLDQPLGENDLLQQSVRTFYKNQFWPDAFDHLDQLVANELFDTGVNQGLGSAIRYFQQALNVLNRGGKDYPNIAADGGIGPATVACYNSLVVTKSYPSRNYDKVIKVLLKWMNYFQMKRYADLAEKSEDQEKFIWGWTERV